MPETKIQLIIEALNKTDSAFNDLKRHLKDSQVDTDALNAKSQVLSGSIGGLAASFVTLGTAIAAIKSGITYLAQIETASLGIAAAFMTGGKYIDATSGKALAAQDALNAAQGDSKKIIEELQYANLQTIATLDELIAAYQVTLPVALAKGFDRQQVKDFTVAMVQAAGAIGLQMNQLGEETRSLLTGAIDPRNSRIATVLGLRNEDVNKFKGDAGGLFNFLMDKLAAYRVAGVAAQDTWAGLWSNFKDIISQSLGKAIEPLFDALKYELKSVADSIVTIDDKAKKIKWNPEFLEGVTAFRDGIQSVIAEVYRLGMLLDKVGGSFTRLMHGATFSELTGSDRWTKANDEYRERYMKSEKALQDMAMRSQGWKPVTADIDKQMREAAAQGIKKYEQTQTNVGGEDAGTQQLLRYYRDIGPKQKPEWGANTPKPEVDKKLENLKKEWEKTSRDLETDIDKQGLSEFEKKIEDVKNKETDLIGKFKKIPGAEEAIKSWAAESKQWLGVEDAQKEAEKAWKIEQDMTKAREDLNKHLTDLTASETEKRIKHVDEEAQKARELASESYNLLTPEGEKNYQDALIQITQSASEQKKKITADYEKSRREAEIDSLTAALDIAEKEGLAHRKTINERIQLMTELESIQTEYLESLDKTKDTTAWYQQAKAIESTRKSIADLMREKSMQDTFGAMKLAMTDLENKWTDVGQQMYDVATTTAQAMQQAFSDFFFDAFQGKLKSLGDYVTSFCNSVNRAIANALSQQMSAGVSSGIGGFFDWMKGSGSTPLNTGNEPIQLGADYGGGATTAFGMHSGGKLGLTPTFYRIVPTTSIMDSLPRRHSGGLASDERLVVNKVGERYITEEQNDWLTGVARSMDGGGNQRVATNENHVHVHLNVNALDSRSVSQAIQQHANQITGIVNQAFNKRGQRGPNG